MELTTKNENRGRWQPGQSGNLAGKPAGARHRFSAAFLEDLAETWAEHGRSTMLATIKQAPATFFAIAARLIPADVKVSIEQTFGDLTAEDYAILIAKLRKPDSGKQAPTKGPVHRSKCNSCQIVAPAAASEARFIRPRVQKSLVGSVLRLAGYVLPSTPQTVSAGHRQGLQV